MPDYESIPKDNYEWSNTVYGNPKEQIPKDLPTPLGKPVMTTTYVDANLMHDILSGRSVTGILHLVNKTPIEWYSKKQATVETATYGSEFVAARIATDQIIDLRATLRYLGVPLQSESFMFGDNKSVITNATIPHSQLAKRHHCLSYHRVREAVASGILRFHHISGETNPADVVSKHYGHQAAWPLLKPLLFWQGDTAELLPKAPNKVDKLGNAEAVVKCLIYRVYTHTVIADSAYEASTRCNDPLQESRGVAGIDRLIRGSDDVTEDPFKWNPESGSEPNEEFPRPKSETMTSHQASVSSDIQSLGSPTTVILPVEVDEQNLKSCDRNCNKPATSVSKASPTSEARDKDYGGRMEEECQVLNKLDNPKEEYANQIGYQKG